MKTQEIALQMTQERYEAWGIEKGKAEQKNLFVENLLQSTDFSDERIASLADVSIALVQEIKSKLS